MADTIGLSVTADTKTADASVKKTRTELIALSDSAIKADSSVTGLETTVGKGLVTAEKKAITQTSKTTKEIKDLGSQSALSATSIKGLSTQFQAITATIGALGIVAGTTAFVKLADEFQGLEARVRDATKATGDFETVFQSLVDGAIETGSSLNDTVDVFQRLSTARKELGVTNAEIV